MKSLILLFTFTFVIRVCYGQVEPNPGSHRMQASSQAHSLQNSSTNSNDNSGNLISIDKSGDVTFSIPLVIAKGRKLSLPITANYKAGIKVDQKSSEIGLGWSINFGSITRDYGSFEPDYAETSVETKMYNQDDSKFGTLTNSGATGSPFSNNKELIYNNIQNSIGSDNEKMTPDNFHVSIPGKGNDVFWNNGTPNSSHDFKWNQSSPWKIEFQTKTFEIDQEYSRINELTYQNIHPTSQLDHAGNIAAAICIPPYVEDKYFERSTTGGILSSGTVYQSKVRYRDFESFSITNEEGITYVFGRALRGQKYLFTEDPFWSTMPNVGNNPWNAAYGEWWKIDFIAEWLLTEIRSSDYFDSNNNGELDENDEGDWIKIQYTDPHQSESIPGSNVKSIIVPKHREWMNFTQTDTYSSLMRERAYVKKIITPTQEIDFSISQKFDVNHDYFKIPLNNPDINQSYIYKTLTPPGGGSNNAFHIHYPIELMKYDSIRIFENFKQTKYHRNKLISKVNFSYAKQGSSQQLAVSNFLIRNNNDEEITSYDPSIVAPDINSLGVVIGGFNVDDYYKNEGRGKLTLLEIDFINGDDVNHQDPRTYRFKYNFNPKLDFLQKHSIIKKNSFPTLRQSLVKHKRTSFLQNNVKTSILPYTTKEIAINKWGNNMHDYNYEVKSCIIKNIDNQEGKDLLGYYFNPSLNNQGRDAWTLTEIINPLGGTIVLEYENDNFDYNHDLTISSDRQKWKDLGSIIDDDLPYISFYNTSAEVISLYQAYINAFHESSLKKLYRSYSMPLSNNAGGIRLKTKTKIDGINENIITKYEYGPGHYTAIPKDYWSNYIEGFSSFIQSESVRQESSSAYYNLSSEFTDFETSMIYLSNNLRIGANVGGIHYYEYIDVIDINSNSVSDRPFKRSSYGGAQNRQATYFPQFNVTIKGYDRINKPIVELLTQEINLIDHIKLLKEEKFESNSSTPYDTRTFFYNQDEYASRALKINDFELDPLRHPLYFDLPGPEGLVYASNPGTYVFPTFSGSHSWTHPFVNCSSIVDPDLAEYNLLFNDNVLGNDPEAIWDNGFRTETLSRITNQSIRSNIQKIEQDYLGINRRDEYTYEPTYGLLKEVKKNNSQKNIGGSLVEQSIITEYDYGFEDSSIGNLFENKNMLVSKIGTTNKLESNWTTIPSSNILKSSAQTWKTSNTNGLYNGDQFEYNSEIVLSGLAAGTVTSFFPFNSNTNNPKWEVRLSETAYNRHGQLWSSRHNNIYTLNTYGYNYSLPKAKFYQTNKLSDATYTGFEDLNDDDGSYALWDASEEEFWYDLNINRNFTPLKSMALVYVWQNQNPVCVASNTGPPCVGSQTSCTTSNGVNGLLFSYGDYEIRINNHSGNWAVGDQVKFTKNLDPEVNININNIPHEQTNLPDFETTISNIIFAPTNSNITTQFGFPQSLVDYSDWDEYDYYLCFSDPIPQEYIWHFGVNIEKVNSQVTNSFVTQDDANTGEYSYHLGNRQNASAPTQKTPIRPVKIAGLGRNYSPYIASFWLKKQNNSNPSGEIRLIHKVWNNNRTAVLDGGTIVITGIDSDWKYFEFPIERTTIYSGNLEVYIENAWTAPQSTNTLYVDDLLIYPEDAKYEYYSFDKYLNVISYTDNNDNSAKSTYDHWGRIFKLYDFKGQLLSENNYFNTSNIALDHNFEEVTSWIDDTNQNTIRKFRDGFGKEKQTSITEPSKNRRIIQTVDYDHLGRLKREYNSLGEYGLNHGNKASNDYELKLVNLYGSSSTPFKAYEYLSRPEVFNSEIKHQFQLGVPSALVQSEETYNLNNDVILPTMQYSTSQLFKTIVTDENIHKTESYLDKFGNLVCTKSEIGLEYNFSLDGEISFDLSSTVEYAETFYKYDGANNNTVVIDPESIITEKAYNSLGQIVSHNHPDKGRTEYKYNLYGQLRFVKDANDINGITSNNYVDAFTYYKYDRWNRIIEIGKYLPISGSAAWNSSALLNDIEFPLEGDPDVQLHKKWIYDGPKLINANGRLWKEIVFSNHQLSGQEYISSETDSYLYEYDSNGNLLRKEFDLDGLSNNHSLNYSYNRQGTINQIEYKNDGNPSSNYIEVLTYDDLGRLESTSSGSDLNSLTTDSEYIYDALGKLKSYTLAENSSDKETISLQYDIRDRLISQVSENFRFKLDYDLKSNIIGQTWSNSHFDILNLPYLQNKYEYYYDNYDRLIGANYSQLSSDNFPFQNYANLINSIQPDFNCIYIFPNISEIDFRELLVKYESFGSDKNKYPLLNKALKVLKDTNVKPGKFADNISQLDSEITNREQLDARLNKLILKTEIKNEDFIIESRNLLESQTKKEGHSEISLKLLEALNQEKISSGNKKKQIVSISKEVNDDLRLTKSLLAHIKTHYGILQCTLNPVATSLRPVCEALSNPNVLPINIYDTQYRYSKSGNFINLKRNDDQGIDKELKYSYLTIPSNSNKLDEVEHWSTGSLGFSQSFDYDSNGNVTKDDNSSYSHEIIINPFNMITHVENNSTSISSFRYDIANNRVHKSIPNTTDEYNIGHVVVNQSGNPIQYGITDGYVNPSNNSKEYSIIDWLGTPRVNIQDNNQVTHCRDHYPYGLLMPDRISSNNSIGEKFQFTGHEYDSEISYEYHGARYYNREIGSYLQIDPLENQFKSITGYNYSFVDPINNVDPTGKSPDQWAYKYESDELVKIGEMGGDKIQYVSFVKEHENGAYYQVGETFEIQGKDLLTGPVARNRYKDGEFDYGISSVDLWNNVPQEYQGHYTGADLVERYKASIQSNGLIYNSILEQEERGLSRYEMIWNNRDYGLYLDQTYGNRSGLVMADDGGILDYMLPSGVLSKGPRANNAMNKYNKSFGKSFSPNFTSSSLKLSSNPWIRFLQVNKGRYSGKNWLNSARNDYYKSK